MTKARTQAAKRRARAARRQSDDMGLAPTPKRPARGRARMAEIAADVPALEARARKVGIAIAHVADGAPKAVRKAAADARAAQLREMRAPWYGCNAGRAMAASVTGEGGRADMWAAICHIRATQAAYDHACGAPSRHAKCLSLLAPTDAVTADAASPPLDLRSDGDKARQAVSAWMQMQDWLSCAGPAAGECRRTVVDDETCRDRDGLIRALRCVVDGIKGHKMFDRSRPATPL